MSKEPTVHLRYVSLISGSYAGFEGEVKFDRIGAEFPPSVPVEALRLVPAVLGSLVVPLVYQIAVELGLSRWAALLAGSFVLLGRLVGLAFPSHMTLMRENF